MSGISFELFDSGRMVITLDGFTMPGGAKIPNRIIVKAGDKTDIFDENVSARFWRRWLEKWCFSGMCWDDFADWLAYHGKDPSAAAVKVHDLRNMLDYAVLDRFPEKRFTKFSGMSYDELLQWVRRYDDGIGSEACSISIARVPALLDAAIKEAETEN